MTLQTITIDNGIWGYWKMDDGTGSLVRDSSRYDTRNHHRYSGDLHEFGWVTGTTGAVLFYDRARCSLTAAAITSIRETPSIRETARTHHYRMGERSTATNKHTILPKKSTTGASAVGYALWLDDSTDTLQFAASDGGGHLPLLSTSTFASPGWRHVALNCSGR